MTISTETRETTHTGDGSTTAFGYSFKVFTQAEMLVTLDNVETPLGWTISGLGNNDGGIITFAVAPANGTAIVFASNYAYRQLIDYDQGDPFPSASHEQGLDRGVMLAQQNRDAAIRALQYPAGEPPETSQFLPDLASRANLPLGFDGQGNPVAFTGQLGTVPTTPFGEGLVTQGDAAQARAYIDVPDKTHRWDNLLLNPQFVFYRRKGASEVVPVADNEYVPDQWRYNRFLPSGGEIGIKQDLSAVFGSDSGGTMTVRCSTARGAQGANMLFLVEQPIEGLRARNLAWGSVSNAVGAVLAVWAQVDDALRTICVCIRDETNTASYVQPITFTQLGVPQLFTFIVPPPPIGTWNMLNNICLKVGIVWDAGVNFQIPAASAGTWFAGNAVAVDTISNNFQDTLNAQFRIHAVSVHAGDRFLGFPIRDASVEEILLNRYYATSYSGAVPGAPNEKENSIACVHPGTSTALANMQRNLERGMYRPPTVRWYSSITGAIDNVHNESAGTDLAVASTQAVGFNSVGYPVLASGPPADQRILAQYTAEAVLL